MVEMPISAELRNMNRYTNVDLFSHKSGDLWWRFKIEFSIFQKRVWKSMIDIFDLLRNRKIDWVGTYLIFFFRHLNWKKDSIELHFFSTKIDIFTNLPQFFGILASVNKYSSNSTTKIFQFSSLSRFSIGWNFSEKFQNHRFFNFTSRFWSKWRFWSAPISIDSHFPENRHH